MIEPKLELTEEAADMLLALVAEVEKCRASRVSGHKRLVALYAREGEAVGDYNAEAARYGQPALDCAGPRRGRPRRWLTHEDARRAEGQYSVEASESLRNFRLWEHRHGAVGRLVKYVEHEVPVDTFGRWEHLKSLLIVLRDPFSTVSFLTTGEKEAVKEAADFLEGYMGAFTDLQTVKKAISRFDAKEKAALKLERKA